ncbi:TonB-dependent receptor [Microbulbifer celer]|uniref:TonB-dependent receptor n=1 Tax=Microbulbifer celer TaxID=435905 RepID=A0ABW3UC51_9GAMM|nr:TonB-dependent receptor [Microbulbifer celer]UFN56398.1 TonB-dependent receptor [Microbulbifer celer]
MFERKKLSGAVVAAITSMACASVLAQDATLEEVVVTGIRASMDRAMDIKRDASGVVDAISAEDIGKFPSSNLAESLQRIPGVAIDRQNGEGSKITVRGFGPGYNLVTLNGRTLPTATVGIMGQRDNYTGAQGRSFGFENLTAEGISGLEVYKTGNALVPSGGLGATVNINTLRPLESDNSASMSFKTNHDTSVGSDGDSVTPELSGLFNWSNEDSTFGIGVFGSYSERDSGAVMGQANDWVVSRQSGDFLSDTSKVRADGDPSNYQNVPVDGELFAIPQDSRYDYSELTRERFNGQLVAQYTPTDSLRFTADYTFASNEQAEMRFEQTNWFATPFDQLIFDGSGPVNNALFMQENNDGTKDIGFEQTNRATKESLDSFGLNMEWDLAENQTLRVDGHSSTGEARPNNPLGHTSTFVDFAAPVILQHSLDWRSGFPVQDYTIDDSAKGNGNGVLDVGDLATQVQRSSTQQQDMDVKELDVRYTFDWESSQLDLGVNYRDTEVFVATASTQQDIGTWGMAELRNVEELAPGLVEAYCLECQFGDYSSGRGDVSFRADAAALFPIFQEHFLNHEDPALRTDVTVSGSQNTVQEDIMAYYANYKFETELFDIPVQLNAGLRYEETEVESFSLQTVPTGVSWTADNDFVINYGSEEQNVEGLGKYHHLLPNLDLKFDLTENLVGRVSYSETIGRVPYSNLFSSTTVQAPNNPTALGGQTGGNLEDPSLLPLESKNFDISAEWYFADSSYVSVGYFDKTVDNFLGTGVFKRSLFDLRDPSSGAAGTRSGDALAVIDELGIDQSPANLFTMVALIDANNGNVAAAQSEFESKLEGGQLPQSYVDQILGAYDVNTDSSDPLMEFEVTQPINEREGNIDGWEFAAQHFFGDTGFGLAGSYTMVNGDVEADPAQDPSENQFALTGLGDTFNVTAIYENFGWSARLAYNWRDEFLNATNQGGSRSPQFTDEYGQYDLSVSYDINDNLQVQFEGINLTGEDQLQYRREKKMVIWAYELEPRYALGVRYKW